MILETTSDREDQTQRKQRPDKGDGRVLLLKWGEKVLTLLYDGNRLMRASASVPEEDVLGNIYIGKVKNVAEGIQAAFVEYMPGKLCFLPLKGGITPVVTNRKYNGRIVAGDEVAVQICADSQKEKEARARADLSFTGKYVTLIAGRKQVVFPPGLPEKLKERLKAFTGRSALFAQTEKEYGIRFEESVRSLTDLSLLEEELEIRKAEADRVYRTIFHRTCFSLLRKSPAVWLENLREYDDADYAKILTDDSAIFEETREYLTQYQPSGLQKLVFYEDDMLPLHKLYSVESRLTQALERKVWLKSGAYLVIEKTEAMTCIDVNSGKYTGKKEKEETFFRINVEAAQEIGRQLRLRNISGIVMIDFISMKDAGYNKKLMDRLREIVCGDPVRTTVVDMTPLGLVEVTRKKEKKSLWEQLNRRAGENRK